MSDSAVIAGSGLALGAVTLTGTILGMHYDALAVGFFAALVAVLHMPPREGDKRTPLHVFWLISAGSFMAGLFAPATAQAAQAYLPWLAALDRDTQRITAAGVIGVTVNVAIPLLYAVMTRKAGGGQ